MTALTLLAATVHLPLSDAAFSDVTHSAGNSFTADTLAPPTAISATGGAEITLDWTATVDTYADGHRVLRSTSPGGPYTQVAEVTPRTTVVHVDSPAEGTYYYVLRAFDGNWESANSVEVSESVALADLVGTWQTGTTHTAAAGTNRVLVFNASNEQGSATGPSLVSVSYGGQALTPVLTEEVTSSSVTARLEIWILDEAGIVAATNSTFTATWSSTAEAPLYAHAVFEHVNQASPTGASTTATAAGDTPNPVPMSALATSDGDVVLAAATAGERGTYVPQNGFTLGVTEDDGVNSTELGTAYKQATGANETASMLFNSDTPPEIRRQAVGAFVLQVSP